MNDARSRDDLLIENEDLRLRLEEAEETLRAIGDGEVDAFVVTGEEGERVFTLTGADTPYRILVETMNEGAASLGPDGTILYCNACLAAMLEMPLEKLIGTRASSYVAPEDREYFSLRIAGPSGQKREEGISLLTGSGGTLPVVFSFGMLGRDLTAGLGVVFTDISGITKVETELRQEKTHLVELLHRIKNTFAQIDAFARTEASLSADQGISEALNNFAGRVGALSSLFTMLDSGGKLGRVRLDLYLADVAQDLLSAIEGLTHEIDLRLDLDSVTMDGKQAANMGLIINELITNAIKYSFKGKGGGELSVGLKLEADRIALSVSSDGAELPKDFDPTLSKGLGMSIVAGLAQQMGGKFSWTGGKGARFRVDIPVKKETVPTF
ncbi:MAG: ATP-binding protein [Spirochaetota bacterium]